MATPDQILKVRMYCYYPTPEELPDLIIEANIDKWLSLYPKPSDEPVALYNATLDCLRYLIFKESQKGFTSGMMRSERVGQVSVDMEVSEGYVSPWKKLLDDYLSGNIAIPGFKVAFAPVIIGGVSKQEIWRVSSNPDSNNGLGRHKGIDKKSLDTINPYPYRWRRNR